jgi:hypothetical protein
MRLAASSADMILPRMAALRMREPPGMFLDAPVLGYQQIAGKKRIKKEPA